MKLIRELGSQVGEHFPDYLLIARVKDGMIWRFSDPTYAYGAAMMFSSRVRDWQLPVEEE